ncbi:MAG TPA: winged helix-turn-helix domain-containing protein, partial [Spirochaetia bacterium]|nr:winged helix-turn-helix domain-containing protein [Spirochaetia bacterium]
MARDADVPAPRRALAFPSLTAELLFAANLVASDPADRPDADQSWVDRQRGQLPGEVRNSLGRFRGLWWPTMGLIDLFCWNGQFDDPEAFLADVEQFPVDRFLAILFNQDFTVEQIREFLAKPSQVRQRTVELCEFSSGTEEALEGIFADPEGHRRCLVALIRSSDTPLFRQSRADWLPQAQEAAKIVGRRLEAEDPFEVMESLRQKPIPGPRQFGRFSFIPSLFIGHRHIRSWAGDHYIFFFQEGTVGLQGPTEASAALADFLKILGDKTRMDILRLLSHGPSYGKQLSTNLGLTTATVSRHLDQLKAAGVVTEDRADSNNVKLVRLVPETLEA